MTSPETLVVRARPTASLWWACVRMQHRENRRRYPPLVAVTSVYFPPIVQTVMWVLIGQLAGGRAGAQFALTGAVALAIMRSTVAEVSDIPMEDKWLGTYFRTATSVASPFGVYVARCVAMAARSLVVAIVCLVVAAPVCGLPGAIPGVLVTMPVLVTAAVSATLLGLFAIAPAIGTRLDTLTYNLATALITVVSGALIPLGNLGVVAHVGAGLPLQHAISAMRAAQGGEPFWGQVCLELAVGAGWAVAAWAMYRWQAWRARNTGASAY